jgi:hypothetical protein
VIWGALAGLIALMLVPRAAHSGRGLVVAVLAGVVIGGAVWFGWAANLPTATDRAVPLIGMIVAGAAFGFGVLARGVVLMGRARGWPGATDILMTCGVAVMFSYGFLRLFDVL